jgi:hypothetical protein
MMTQSDYDAIAEFLQQAQARIKAHPRKLNVDPIYALAVVGLLVRWLKAQEPPPPQQIAEPPPKKSRAGRPRKGEKRAVAVADAEQEAGLTS